MVFPVLNTAREFGGGGPRTRLFGVMQYVLICAAVAYGVWTYVICVCAALGYLLCASPRERHSCDAKY